MSTYGFERNLLGERIADSYRAYSAQWGGKDKLEELGTILGSKGLRQTTRINRAKALLESMGALEDQDREYALGLIAQYESHIGTRKYVANKQQVTTGIGALKESITSAGRLARVSETATPSPQDRAVVIYRPKPLSAASSQGRESALTVIDRPALHYVDSPTAYESRWYRSLGARAGMGAAAVVTIAATYLAACEKGPQPKGPAPTASVESATSPSSNVPTTTSPVAENSITSVFEQRDHQSGRIITSPFNLGTQPFIIPSATQPTTAATTNSSAVALDDLIVSEPPQPLRTVSESEVSEAIFNLASNGVFASLPDTSAGWVIGTVDTDTRLITSYQEVSFVSNRRIIDSPSQVRAIAQVVADAYEAPNGVVVANAFDGYGRDLGFDAALVTEVESRVSGNSNGPTSLDELVQFAGVAGSQAQQRATGENDLPAGFVVFKDGTGLVHFIASTHAYTEFNSERGKF